MVPSACQSPYTQCLRFTNSFNTNNPARDIKPLFLDSYEVQNWEQKHAVLSLAFTKMVAVLFFLKDNFQTTPVFIGEYHSAMVSTKKALAVFQKGK